MFNVFPIELYSYQLKVLSAISSNLTAGFIALAITTKDPLILMSDLAAAILCGIIAVRIEKILHEHYD